MIHPDDLLAEFEDGTLADRERAVLERHLASCARCREQVELARAAKAALASAPDAVAPAAIGDRAIADAVGATKPRRPAWTRWAGAAAAVAAAIAVGALVLPNIGSPGPTRAANAPGALAAGSAQASVVRPASGIETQNTDYDAQAVSQLARSYQGHTFGVATDLRGPIATPPPGPTTAFGSASSCLGRAASGDQGELVRLIEARYEGTPAYIGVYLSGPGAGQPADGVRVLVVPTDSCSHILTSTWSKI
jgi:putative zinc finger protein